MKKLCVCILIFLMFALASAELLTGQMLWNEDGSSVTNVAAFSFDTAIQLGNISEFWVDEQGTWTFEDGYLADGSYDFTLSSIVTTYDELINFDSISWSIYEERILGAKVDDVSATLGNNRFQITHWIYLIQPGPSSASGSFSVVPEPATALLFGLGGFGAFLLRRNRLRQKKAEQ